MNVSNFWKTMFTIDHKVIISVCLFERRQNYSRLEHNNCTEIFTVFSFRREFHISGEPETDPLLFFDLFIHPAKRSLYDSIYSENYIICYVYNIDNII